MKSEDDILDEIMETTDDLFWAGEFAQVDAMLADVDPTKLPTVLSLGWIVATYPARDKLPNHVRLVRRMRAHLEATEPPERVEALMANLED